MEAQQAFNKLFCGGPSLLTGVYNASPSRLQGPAERDELVAGAVAGHHRSTLTPRLSQQASAALRKVVAPRFLSLAMIPAKVHRD